MPGQVNFQGVLLDDTGAPVSGSVNFGFALFDAATGGTGLWSENQAGVAVTDGMYSVALGSVTPLTAGILGAGAIYLEISVEGEILSPRQRLLAVPYALTTAEAENVAGTPGTFVQQIFLNADWDGQAIPNDDPLEGVADTDGDGLANFIDPDNDNDGIPDDLELANGTGVNLPTPVITAITPAYSRSGSASLVTITGSGFLSGLTVQAGTENPVPQNLTDTRFDISIGTGQVPGPATLTVTNPNAETTAGVINFYGPKLVFITSDTLANTFTLSLAEADAFCAAKAAGAGFSGSFIAWLSDPAAGISARDRLPTGGGPWTRLDGELVAADLADLTDGFLLAGIRFDDSGSDTGFNTVATKTLRSGLFDPNSCMGSHPADSLLGATNGTTPVWTEVFYGACTGAYRLYCFEE